LETWRQKNNRLPKGLGPTHELFHKYLMLIDTLQKFAVRLQPVRLALLVLSGFSFVALLFILITSTTHSGDRFLVPAILGLLWSLSGYAFILNFRSVPRRDYGTGGFIKRLKLRLLRLWYWVLALLFFGTTLALLLFSIRLLRIWIQDYGN
jgi:hypothetical protein